MAALIPSPADPSKYLVQQRLPNKTRPNLWEFPGGKVEPGETDEQALARECEEELAVTLKVGRRRWGKVHPYPDFTVVLELYEGEIVSGEPKALSSQAVRFCSPAEMQALDFCPADVPLIAALVRGEV